MLADRMRMAGGGKRGKVASLLHFNGVDGSTTIIDETGKIWNVTNAVIDTQYKKLGSGALGLWNVGDAYIETPDHDDFDVGNGDFTLECFFMPIDSSKIQTMIGKYNSTLGYRSFFIQIGTDNKLHASVYQGTTGFPIISSDIINGSVWHHGALERYNDILTLYINGASVGTVNVAGVTINKSAALLTIGKLNAASTDNFGGNIDEFRFSKGIARYKGNFTPPTAEFSL
jgi:hypothetical protein